MTIQVSMTSPANSIPGAEFLFDIKEFLVGLGWTVEGSGDTSTGGMDATDRFVSAASFVLNSWVVLQSPHVTASDRIQIGFRRSAAGVDNGQIFYNPTADYTGGGASTFPTSTAGTSVQVVAGDITSSSGGRQALIGDDTSPYGFAARRYAIGDPSDERGAIAILPLTQQASNPGKPYVVFCATATTAFTSANLTNADINAAGPTTVAEPRLPPQAPLGVGGAIYTVDSVTAAPDGMEVSESSEDFGVPIAFFTKPPLCQYVGFCDFMQWTGSSRTSMSTFNGRVRIVFDDVSFPWDGATVPLP